ncbi:MAG TPA: chromosome segregation protein SMC, partial [Clostridia bacterium]|nr:chromosome segregation protein SMC [Clostridia bacterium]
MYLKHIEMQGFKSFADKITLEFNSGITTVVGPNGSGKSNISDAIRWVLGEQSAKMLRGSKMEDIIFSGTEHRKPVGFSEVSIVIDNSDKKLPLEFSEVVVTRRVFRQGDSEYCINKSPCRLKDIYELFLDTGIGKDGYSIIGQGKIDEILSIKSEDRRNIFEEASGIMKYRVKKNEAERKLENTEQNLLRINDIINELESQIEPLREQSEKARNFLDLREELKVLEIGLYVENLKKYKKNLSSFQDTYDSLKQEYDDKNKQLEDISTDNKSKLENSKELENKLNVLKDEYHNIETEIEKLNSEINLYSEKIKNAIENNERIDSEFVEQDEKTSTIEKEKSQKLKRLEYLNKQFIEFTDKLKLFEMQMEEHLSVLKESERSIEAMKQKVMDKMDLLSDKKVQASNISAHAENINKRKLVIDKEISSNILDIDRENMSLEDVNEFIAKTTIGLNKSRDDMKNYQFNESKIKSELSASLEKHSKTKILIQSKTSRLNLLRDMEKNFEGFNRTVKTILSSSDRIPGFNKGLHGVLARVINIERKYETAIEMALGAASQNIITDSEEDAKRMIDFLKRNNAGRATFLPISSVKAREIEDKILSKLKNMTGFIGIASDLVKFDAVYSNILLSLLGKVIIVDNMENGIRVACELNHVFKIVTLDGDILNPGGSMTGGSHEQRASGIFSRTREILDIENEINESSSKISNNKNEIKELETQLDNIKATIEKTYAIIRDYEHEKIRDEAKQKHIFDNIIRLNLHIEMVKQEKSQLTKKNEDAEKEIKKCEEECNLINSEIVKCKLIIDEHTETFKDKQEDIDLLRDEITNHKISLGSITESIQSANEAIEKLELDKGNFE